MILSTRTRPALNAQDDLQYYSHQFEMDDHLFEQIRPLAIRYGTSYDSYLVTDPDREYLWLDDGSGFISFVTKWRYINVIGGLICPQNRKIELVNGLKTFAKRNNLTVSTFNIESNDLSYFQAAGFEITHFAEDYVIDLTKDVYNGKKYQPLRQYYNSCLKNGDTFKRIIPQDIPPARWEALVDELNVLERENLARKAQKEPTRHFQGYLTKDNLLDRILFVAFSKTGRAEAFIICNPYRQDQEVGMETYRFRVGTSHRMLKALIFCAIQMLKAEGYSKLSLGIIPGLATKRLPRDSALTHTFMKLWINHLSFISNVQGVYHFKTRFRPTTEHRYVCVYPKATLGSAMAFLYVWGGIKVDLWKAIASWWKHENFWRRTWARIGKKIYPLHWSSHT